MLKLFTCRQFKGMIRPNMALSFDDSREVARRKSIPMVDYLRNRRGAADVANPEWLRKDYRKGIASARSAHFRLKSRAEKEGRG